MTSAPPPLSVVIPSYQRLGLTRAAVESVLAQEEVAFEVVVVDDGSTDGSAAGLREAYAGEPRVRLFEKENGGAASARNRGLEEARGDLVVLLDCDDLLVPGALAARAAYFEAHPHVDLALCDAVYEGGWKEDGQTIFGRRHFRPPTSLRGLLDGAWAQASQMAMRRATAGRLRFDESYRVAEDVEFLYRVLLAGYEIGLQRETLVRYRKHGAQLVDDDRAIQEGMIRVLEQYAEHAGDARLHTYQIARRRATLLVREGRLQEARPHLRTWLRTRFSSKALRWYVASFLRR